MKNCWLPILIFVLACMPPLICAQNKPLDRQSKLGIVNGRAVHMPKPVYPQNAHEYCVDGPVEVQVQIGKDGNVLLAKAISGDPLLYKSAEQAASKTKFRNVADALPVRVSGVLVYNFASDKTCLKVGVVNKRAIKIPKPVLPRDYKIQKPIEALVQIVVDMNGDVTYVRTLSEVPLEIKMSVEKSARNTKFSPMLIDGPAIRVKGLLQYRFRPDRIIEF